jgi:hypothetical protein
VDIQVLPSAHAQLENSAQPTVGSVISDVVVHGKRAAVPVITRVTIEQIVQGAVFYVDSSITTQPIARRTRYVNSVGLLAMPRRIVSSSTRRSEDMAPTHGFYQVSTAQATAT